LYSFDFLRKDQPKKIRAWSNTAGKEFLEPFGLGESNSAYCISGREQMTKKLSNAKYVYTACREPDMPFPILVGCIAAKGDDRKFHCFEFTPLYSGCPAVIEDSPERN